jgi:serine/threonine protein kinase
MTTSDRDDALKRDAMAEMDRLLDKTRPERAKHLNALAHSRPDVHALVMDLLEFEDPVNSGFMEPGRSSGSQALQAGSRLGPYRIIRQLGEGGMGEVWLASRDDGLYDGQVAIKTLHPYFAGGALRQRFLREAKVLGRLAHSNIARLLDAGTHDGVVYLVLEYVVGRPIDAACDEEKLDVSARLGIFLQLCAAVAHAHSSLVVHRDIKPGNVLLTAEGIPKLLDFGIASFFEPEKGEAQSDITRLTGRIFTPEYAAPEQVLGQEITTSTDVYSLGVLLYVLLAGRLPYGPADGARTKWEHAVLHDEPARMARSAELAEATVAANRSTTFPRLRRELSGDLENIAQKALEKRPEDRYLTVAAFADDVRRYLQGEPVLARADSAWYRLGKFARRNRLVVGATIAVVVALGAGLAVSLWQLRVAREERRHAEEVKEFVASIFRSADPFFTGKASLSAVDMLAIARERIDRELVEQPRDAVELLNIVGESQSNLDEEEAAKATFEKSIELAERLQPRDEVPIAEARVWLANIARGNGEFEPARLLYDQALPVLRAHQPRTGRMLATALMELAQLKADDGDIDAAIAFGPEAIAAVSAAMGPGDSETILARRNFGLILVLAKRFDEARPLAEQAFRDSQALMPSGERNALMVATQSLLARLLLDSGGDVARCIELLDSAIALSTELSGSNSDALLPLLNMLARAQARNGDMNAAIAAAQRAFDITAGGLQSSRLLTNLGRNSLMARKVPEALAQLSRAVKLGEEFDTGKGTFVLLAKADYGAALAIAGRFEEAARVLNAAMPLAKENPTTSNLASVMNALGLMKQLQFRWAESEAAFRTALEHTSSSDANQKFRAEALLGIGVARLELGQPAEAEDWIRQADAAARMTFLNFVPLRAEIAVQSGRTLLAQKKVPAARESLAAADDYWRGFDANNRGAGEAAYWLAQAHLAAAARADARIELARAAKILDTSPLPGDAKLVLAARRALAK